MSFAQKKRSDNEQKLRLGLNKKPYQLNSTKPVLYKNYQR